MSDPLRPELPVLVMLGSALVHAEEYLSPRGHPLDRDAFHALMARAEVRDWIDAMNVLALLPLKRGAAHDL